jgi:hydrogenase maturation protease
MNILVLGLGNVIHQDDGAGVEALNRLRAGSNLPPHVRLMDGGTLGIELLPYVQDASHLLLLDAIDVGAAPGTVIRMDGPELLNLPRPRNAHQLGVADLLEAMRFTRGALSPTTVVGVQPGCTDWGVGLTPTVEAAMPAFVHTAIAAIESLGCTAVTVRPTMSLQCTS